MTTISSSHIYGALYYDAAENVFWGGGYEDKYELYKIALNGTVLSTINYHYIVPAARLALDPYPGYVDGITIDPISKDIFFSTDLGLSVYRITQEGAYVGYIDPTLGNSGVTTDTKDLWLAYAENPTPIVKKFSTAGTVLQSVTLNIAETYQIEDLEFDDKTFAPKCVLWALNAGITVRAIEIECPGTSRESAITDIIESVALEQAALAHILNAEGKKIQKMTNLSGINNNLLLKANQSVLDMVKSISMLEMVLQSKLNLFRECLCADETPCTPITDITLTPRNPEQFIISKTSNTAFTVYIQTGTGGDILVSTTPTATIEPLVLPSGVTFTAGNILSLKLPLSSSTATLLVGENECAIVVTITFSNEPV